MTTEQITVLLSGVQALVIVLSFLALVWQLKQITRNMRQDAYSRIIEDYSRIAERLLDNPSLSRFFYEGNPDFAHLSEEERGFYNYLGLSLAFFERVYLLHRRNGVEAGIWSSWERWLKDGWLKTKLFPMFWKNERLYFSDEFSAFVDASLARIPAVNRSDA